MTLTKIVDGVPVAMTAAEETAFLAEQAAAAARDAAHDADQARLATVDTAIAADATVAALKAMTVAEFDTWWTANVTTLAQANNVLKRVTRVVIRRLT